MGWRSAAPLLLMLGAAACGPLSFPNGVAPDALTREEQPARDDAPPPPGPMAVGELLNRVPVVGLSGDKGIAALYRLDVPAGATGLTFHLEVGAGGSGEAQLLVRSGAQPTLELFDCRTPREDCRFDAPVTGSYFALLQGLTPFSGAEVVASYTPRPPPKPARTDGARLSIHLAMGVPDGSSADVSSSEHYLSLKPQYVVSYNAKRKVANWASWELNPSYLGTVNRSGDFRPDDTLPATFAQPTNDDYQGSGFDRGHLCPSADRNATVPDNSSTYYLSNMIPQSGNNNRGAWASFENYARDLVRAGNQLFVVAGGIFVEGGRTIGAGVAVPVSTFKVVVVLPANAKAAADVSPSTRVIALLLPNDDALITASADWRKYRVTARDVEAKTGLDFLSDVPQEIQDIVETRTDAQ